MIFPLNIALVGIFVALAWRMYKDNSYALMPVASVALILTWQGLSVAYLETGVYSPELMLTTYQTGATLRYVLAIVSFLLSYWLVFRWLVSHRWIAVQKCSMRRLESAERFALPLLVICLIAIVVLLGYAPRGEFDSRSKYLVENPIYLRDRLLDFEPYIALILGYATGVTSSTRIRLLGYFSLLLMLLMLYLYGNKFSAISETAFFFCMPFVALANFRPMDRRVFGLTMRRQILIGTAVLLLIITGGLLRQIQYLQSSGSETAGVQYIAERVFVLQGGIWWNTDNSAIDGVYQPGFKEFAEFVRGEGYFKGSSLKYLMSRAIGYDLTNRIFTVDNALFTGTFPAIFYEIGGRFGPVLFGTLSGAIIAVFAGYATRKVLQGQVLMTIVALGIYLPISNIASAAEFTPLASLGLLAKIGLVACLELRNLMIMTASAADLPTEA